LDVDVVLFEDFLDLLQKDEFLLVHVLDFEEVFIKGFKLPDFVNKRLQRNTSEHKQLLVLGFQTRTNNRQRYLQALSIYEFFVD
jgi:hypothetical protein